MKQQTIALFALFAFALSSLLTIGFDRIGGLHIQLGRSALADITVTKARIGCLDIQKDGNLTGLVGQACSHRISCSYKAPTEDAYKRAGVHAATRFGCTQAMEITYQCGDGQNKSVTVPGDAWNNPPAQLVCEPPPPQAHIDSIHVTRARIGCLDIQRDGNLTNMVARACNDKKTCSFKAPTQDAYQRAGVQAATRTMCTQAMEIIYDCGRNDAQTVTVPGDAWNHPPAQLQCLGSTVANNEETVRGLPEEACEADWPSKYVLAPPDMLDWTPLDADTFPILNHPPPPAARNQYNTTSSRSGSPGSTIGANEGRLAAYLRLVAGRKDPEFALCESAKAFAGNTGKAAGVTLTRPTGPAWGNAMADLAVTGHAAFERFRTSKPTLESLRRSCGKLDDTSYNHALDRAYAVANAIRVRSAGAQPAAERRALGWIAVSGEDDKPYRPVNVPTAPFPQFNVDVDVRGLAGPVQSIFTRYMIAHARPPAFRQAALLVDGGSRKVQGDLEPTIAADSQVILFIHGMDSRAEEALNLTRALHQLALAPGGKNWTIIALDLPTSGYTDSIDHNAFGKAGDVTCHHTPVVDFLENFIVKFVDAVDGQTGGHLKSRIRAVVGGSLGGNMSMRLGRRNFLPGAQQVSWLHNVVPWSPAAIWPPMTNRGGVMAGCDHGWDASFDVAIGWPRGMADVSERPNDRRNLFYGGFDYAPPGHRQQAQYWWRDDWKCKGADIIGGRVDRHETYDSLFRKWHWRLAAEQLAFSQRQNQGSDPTRGELVDPLFLYNRTRTLLIAGVLDVGGDLGSWTQKTAPLMKNTPGMFRFLDHTGHSLDDERPAWVAKQIVDFLASDPQAPK